MLKRATEIGIMQNYSSQYILNKGKDMLGVVLQARKVPEIRSYKCI